MDLARAHLVGIWNWSWCVLGGMRGGVEWAGGDLYSGESLCVSYLVVQSGMGWAWKEV